MSGGELALAATLAHQRLVGAVLLSMGAVGVVVGGGFYLTGPAEHVDGGAMVLTGLVLGAAGAWQRRASAAAR